MSVGGEDAVPIFDEAYKGNLAYITDKLENNNSGKNWLTLQDSNGRIVLHWAALNGNEDLVKYLISKGSKVDIPDDIGMTPLILAASAGRLQACQQLIFGGANVNAQNEEGHSALQYATSKGWTEIVNLLLENDADINIADKRGATPLHRAASKGMTPSLRLLLTFSDRIKINAKDIYGNTPLHLSCEEDRIEESSALVIAGADLTEKNKEGKTPLELGSSKMAKALQQLQLK